MLTGVRVLDLTRVLAGPLCTMMLGDLGANIIKIERPGSGDETRGWGPPFDERGQSAYFLSVNRNKKSISADVDHPGDRDLVLHLLAGADVVVDNFRLGVLERHGLAPEGLLTRFPRLIWCTITGFGAQSNRPGYDFVVQAECGWMAITGAPDGPPTKVGVALADVISGKDAAIAVLGALVARDRTGTGRRVFISLAHSATAALGHVAQNVLVTGEEAGRWGNAHPNLVPYQLFDTADRPVVIAVGTDAQWHACAGALGLDALQADGRLVSNAGRLAHREMLVAALATRLREASAASWLAVLDRAGVPCGVVKGVLEALRDSDVSVLTGVAPSVPGWVRFPPPKLNEHGAAIRERGWDVFNG